MIEMDMETINAIIAEQKAEIEYLKSRNLSLSVATQRLGKEIETLRSRIGIEVTNEEKH